MFVVYLAAAAAVLGWDCVYALSRPISAGYLAVSALVAITAYPWTKYEKSLTK